MSEQLERPHYLRTLDAIIRADYVPGPGQGEWTYSHYATLPDDERYEIIDGVLYRVPTGLLTRHQEITVLVSFYLMSHVKFKKMGKVYSIPFDVELAPKTVVQPDVLVVLKAHTHILTPSHVVGSPDLIVEVVSPGSQEHDRNLKFDVYARSGIQEYWLADMVEETVEVWTLKDDHYQLFGAFSGEGQLQSRVIPTFPVMAKQLFPTD